MSTYTNLQMKIEQYFWKSRSNISEWINAIEIYSFIVFLELEMTLWIGPTTSPAWNPTRSDESSTSAHIIRNHGLKFDLYAEHMELYTCNLNQVV